MSKFLNVLIGFKNVVNNYFFRPEYNIDDSYFSDLLVKYYDADIKSKYVPEIHQVHYFEETHLSDIINYNSSKTIYLSQIETCLEFIAKFERSYEDFYQVKKAENITIIAPEYYLITSIEAVIEHKNNYLEYLKKIKSIFELDGYTTLKYKSDIKKIDNNVSKIYFIKSDWNKFLDKEPTDQHILSFLCRYNNLIHDTFNELNALLDQFIFNSNSKIISGNAGTGKSHLVAHLVTSIRKNNDLVIFFKPKLFSGDNINLEEKILQLLQVPIGYTLTETLSKLNEFAIKQNKRCYIIIDALNETTKSNIGFSNIWSNNINSLIRQISLFSNLYFVCTLRKSYVSNIWKSTNELNIVELSGFSRLDDVKSACEKYFKYYKIKPTNFKTADLDLFKVPLLLDLYCKLTNEKREKEVTIQIDVVTYLQIFEDYLKQLTLEVKEGLTLQKSRPITNGFEKSSDLFLLNNEAILSTDEFTDAFDIDDNITQDKSIARAVLEGYLIFIKDIGPTNIEIVKHTQQEVGGYLLAKRLSEQFPDVQELLVSDTFQNKIIGSDETLHHQLRLDILKFLIALKPELINMSDNIDVIRLSWWYIYNGYDPNNDGDLLTPLLAYKDNLEIIPEILHLSSRHWLNPKKSTNFDLISSLIEKSNLWDYELEWNFNIYKNIHSYNEFISSSTEGLKNSELDSQYFYLVAKLILRVLSTTIRELRDKATVFLIKYGEIFPLELLELTVEASVYKDTYVYERLSSVCYGVVLRKQHDEKFIHLYLPKIAGTLFELQFYEKSKSASYNYIIIDSIKHIIDLAILKGVFSLDSNDLNRISNYQYTPQSEWIPPTNEQLNLIKQSNEMSPPEPLRMDFGIYTIPRLIRGEKGVTKTTAIANIYKRILELGYIEEENANLEDYNLNAFYFGNSIPTFQGKIDRLGKKYCWKALFDYAGYLLLNKKLNVFEKDDNGNMIYSRLSDVEVDISFPAKDYKIKEQIYSQNLLAEKHINPEWYNLNKIDSIYDNFKYDYKKTNYTMLYGFVEQRYNNEHKIKSYLLVESFLVKRSDNLQKLKIDNLIFDWDQEVHTHYNYLSNVYFGELYWADNMPTSTMGNSYIPTGKDEEITTELDIFDIARRSYPGKKRGDKVKEVVSEKLSFKSELTLTEYLWESNSQIMQSFREFIPSIKMAKYLNLKSDPISGKILDSNLNQAFLSVDYEDEKFFENKFNYLRSDLLEKYLKENDLVLVYQIKQHSYDENYLHNRLMKFKIIN